MAVQGRIERSGVAWIIYLARKIRWVGGWVGGWLVGLVVFFVSSAPFVRQG